MPVTDEDVQSKKLKCLLSTRKNVISACYTTVLPGYTVTYNYKLQQKGDANASFLLSAEKAAAETLIASFATVIVATQIC